MKTKIKIITGITSVILITISILWSCKKTEDSKFPTNQQITQQQLEEIDNSINTIFELKKNLALNFSVRDTISMGDVYYSDEVKDAVRYEFLMLSEMGAVKEFSHDVQILNDEIMVRPNNNVMIPAIEKVGSYSIDPTSNEKVESSYSSKMFFSFAEKDEQWELAGIEQLTPEYSMDTKYSEDKVFPFIITASDMEQKAKTSDYFKILYEKRKIIEQYFDYKIDEGILEKQLQNLYESNNLIPSSSDQPKQSSLNKTTAVNYAKAWTDNNGSSTTHYNPAYKYTYGHDCANFVSQCLKAGGWQYASPYKNYASLTVWWYNNHNTNTTSDDSWSNTWGSANDLCNYICVYNNYATFKTSAQMFAGAVGLADPFWTPAAGIKTHVMIVTYVSHTPQNVYTIKYSAHTNNALNATLSPNWQDITSGHF